MGISETEFDLFKNYIHDVCGIKIPEEKSYLIETRLSKLLADSDVESFEALYNEIIKNSDENIKSKVIDAITTNETLWFRDKKPWELLEKCFLPKFVEVIRNKEKKKIRIWSAASSTGQEAYSTVIGYATKEVTHLKYDFS